MTWSMPGIDYPVELVYSQTLGFQPDVLMLRCNPQVGNFPASGTVTLSWSATTVTLPNCVVDLGSLKVTPDGKFVQLKVLDRREYWRMAAPISGEYNLIRVGQYVSAKQKNLRQLGTILMTALGESGADVSALPTTVYPPVSWECESVIEAAQTLFEEYGYSVSLGFGSEQVTVVKLGTGASLSSTGQFISSDTIDPKTVPQFVRNCFAHSVAQVRLKLEAIGLDTDGTWKAIDSLSYKPAAGWEAVPPYTLAGADAGLTEEQVIESTGYVRRAYRVMGFADETWNMPDESGELSGLSDILPLQNRLLETENIRADESRTPFKVYGQYRRLEDETGQPPIPGGADTAIGDRVTGRRVRFDGENGMIIFEEPIWRMVSSEYKAADLWLECTIRVRNQTNFSWNHYEYDVEVVPTGTGYHTVHHEQAAETIVEYDSSHEITAVNTNQTSLEDLGDAWAIVVAASYATTASQFKVYHEPKLTLRCDGAILQIKHTLTAGNLGAAVNRTEASRHFEFDRGVPSRAQRIAHLRATASKVGIMRQAKKLSRRESADD